MAIATVPKSGEVGDLRKVALVDTDLHPTIMPADLLSRVSKAASEHLTHFGFRVPSGPASYPRVRNGGLRADAWAPAGGFPGSSADLVRQQHLDAYDIDYAVLTPLQPGVYSGEAPELAAELCRAVNDWTREEWLDVDPRLLGSICVPHEDPDLAVKEIERNAGDSRFVQVLLPTVGDELFGNRKYQPIFRAAAEAGLPVGMHAAGAMAMYRGAGAPSYYLEMHVNTPNTMTLQIISLICSGTFDEIPDLQVVSIECGIAWAAALAWMLDDSRPMFGNEFTLRLPDRPSDVMRRHLWFTTQPIDEPGDPQHLAFAFEALAMTDRIMFSTDYPHWDFDSPKQALPSSLSKEITGMILAENACRLYSLPGRGTSR